MKLAALLAWMGFIFYMSSQLDVASKASSDTTAGILYGIYGFFFPGTSLSLEDFIQANSHIIRKSAHFLEFMILGILSYMNYREYRKEKAILIPFLFSSLYALSDELHQLFVEGRSCQLTDACIDSFGALTGIMICHLFYRWRKRSHS